MILSLESVSKIYSNGVKAIDSVSLELSRGMFGLLGPNGAGKSSLMRTIATLQQPDSGKVCFNGQDIFTNKTAFRRQLGYLPQEFGVYPRASAVSLLDYFAILKGVSSKKERKIRVDKVLELTNLHEVSKKWVSTYSGGMRQRFGIAQLLLNRPRVIIVDEPTAGLDPAERTRFLNVLRNVGSENIVLFSTHLVEDVMDLCQDMGIMVNGRLLSQLDPKTATNNLDGKIWETKEAVDELRAFASNPVIKLSDRYNQSNQLLHRLYASQRPSDACVGVKPKLEDYYFLILNKA